MDLVAESNSNCRECRSPNGFRQPLSPPSCCHCSLGTSRLSVQSSKGLEFRSVIFIGLGQIEFSETQAAQNMKLLYVGMTRAKERLMITASGGNEITERLESMTDPVSAVA